MEVYLQKLLVNQQNENMLREEREQMLKRHERELEEIDERMDDMFNQRNLIMKEFQSFLDRNNINTQSLISGGEPSLTNESSHATKFITSLDSAFKPIVSSALPSSCTPIETCRVISSNNQNDSKDESEQSNLDKQNDTKNKTNSEMIIRMNSEESSSSLLSNEQTASKPSRTLKFTPRLKTSCSIENMPLSRIPESPITTQIESMLNRVRENVIDSHTLNKCIDLLSKPRVVKDKKNDDLHLNVEMPSKDQTKGNNGQSSTQEKVDSPKQPSSPKKRIETPEERKKRIERVLFENPSCNKMNKSTLSKSYSSLNTMDLTQSQNKQHARSSLNLNRYVNRSKIRRNHSLSPLRFGFTKRQKSDEQTESSIPIATDENSPREIRKYKSEQQLLFEDSSVASFEEDSTNTSQNNDLSSELDKCSLQPEEEEEEEEEDDDDDNEKQETEDHLLAPSKVIKSQEAFKQVFFPVDLREKPLMTKEELTKIKGKKLMIKSKSIGWTPEANDQSTLRVDYLSHLRRSSTSPEQKKREKELNQLNNTHKFRCYQDFWENKTKEILAKNQKYENWQKNPPISNPKPSKPNESGSPSKDNKHPEIVKKTDIQTENSTENVMENNKASNQNIIIDDKENKVTLKPMSTKIMEIKKYPASIVTVSKNSTNSNDNSSKMEPINIENQTKNVNSKLNVPVNTNAQKSPSPSNYSDSDSEKLIEKLRYFKQDIRRQKMKQQMKQQQISELNIVKPTPTKSLDLQYLTKHNLTKQQSFQLQPSCDRSLTEPPNRNRIKLVRSYSRENSHDSSKKSLQSLDSLLPTISTASTRGLKTNMWKNHGGTNSLSLDQTSTGVPMRSTYF